MNLKRAPFNCTGRAKKLYPLYPRRKVAWKEISLRVNSIKINEVRILAVCPVPNIMEITL